MELLPKGRGEESRASGFTGEKGKNTLPKGGTKRDGLWPGWRRNDGSASTACVCAVGWMKSNVGGGATVQGTVCPG